VARPKRHAGTDGCGGHRYSLPTSETAPGESDARLGTSARHRPLMGKRSTTVCLVDPTTTGSAFGGRGVLEQAARRRVTHLNGQKREARLPKSCPFTPKQLPTLPSAPPISKGATRTVWFFCGTLPPSGSVRLWPLRHNSKRTLVHDPLIPGPNNSLPATALFVRRAWTGRNHSDREQTCVRIAATGRFIPGRLSARGHRRSFLTKATAA